MRPVDSFLQSVRAAFRPSDETSAWVWIALAGCVLSGVALVLITRRRRQQAEQRDFAQLLADRGVSRLQGRLINRLAQRAGITPRSVATHIDAFERATSMELGRQQPSSAGGEEGIFGEVAALRKILGFQQLAGNFPLLTTRELGPGQVVRVAGVEATTVEVNEAFFAVGALASASLPVGPTGSRVRVTFVHGHEARYEARCALMARQAGQSTQKLVFAHDEHPTRIQLRKAVRVTVRGPVRLNPLVPPQQPGHEAATSDENVGNGMLLDISVGGAALEAALHVAVGSLVQLTFDLDGSAYKDLLALVLECEPRPRGLYHMRLEFRPLPQADEHRLAASIARYSAKPFAAEPTAGSPED